MLKPLIVTAAVLLAACSEAPTEPGASPDDTPSFSQGGGAWTEMISGGGRYTHTAAGLTTWVSVNFRKSADGSVSGMFEYANLGLQDWRYHGAADCLAITPAGTGAVAIGRVSLSQGPGAPPLGTRVAIFVRDGGPGNDATAVFFAGAASCEAALGFINFIHFSDANNGNLRIARR